MMEKNQSIKTRVLFALLFILAVAVIGLVVALIVVVTNDDDDDKASTHTFPGCPLNSASSTPEQDRAKCILESYPLVDGEFKFTAMNSIKDPKFSVTATFQLKGPGCDRLLIRYMETAFLEHNDTFISFQAKFTHPNGYRIQEINGFAEERAADMYTFYWAFKNQTAYFPHGTMLSTYIPSKDEHITAYFADASDMYG